MFWKKKSPLNSDEYLKLLQSLEDLRIRFEGLKIDFQLIKAKFKIKAGIPKEEKKDIKDNVFLGNDGNILGD